MVAFFNGRFTRTVSVIFVALSTLYDRLGFGPFLRRQGERLAQLPAG